ncbi:MAG: hypothetical protein RPR97_03795 [Colwellia sp.]
MKTLTLCIACAGLSILTACQSTNAPALTKNAEVNQQTQYFVEAKILLDKLEKEISQGRKDQLAYFAPGTFEEAVEEFDNATEEYIDIGQNGTSSLNVFQSDTEQYKQAKQEIINYIALANQKLKFSYSIKETAESTLAATFSQKALLKDIGAPKVYGKEYEDIIERIDELVEYIDEGEVGEAQEKQPKLLTDMQALEVRTVRVNALGQLDSDIAYIKKKSLAKYVPISHQQLLTARSNANAIITATPRAADEIKTAVELAEFELAHLYHISKEVKVLKNTKSKYYEQYLLAKEVLLHTVTESLGAVDVRDLAMTKQVETIALQAGTMKGKLTTANAAVLALQNDNSQSSVATESLRTEFKNQLVNLNGKYDALVIANSDLNKQLQSKDIELIRLQAYKEAVSHVESKHDAEKELALQVQAKNEALALEAKAKKEVEQKILALQEQAKKEVEQKILALQKQAKKEVEQKSLALQAQTAEKLEVKEAVIEVEEAVVEAAKKVVELPVTAKDNS